VTLVYRNPAQALVNGITCRKIYLMHDLPQDERCGADI